ncbi:hypothetical protein BDQ12DRAFT_684741 [Crucibulum laeve]|uniref:Uncharacterized protein n=1 Tax=Crucibulum laeve TaxID=68775 RepID=A0A5C3LZ58_9AGAR|nr:hypothetical protein BDQ12DRAFT_684741 [Crucibulum laeve]
MGRPTLSTTPILSMDSISVNKEPQSLPCSLRTMTREFVITTCTVYVLLTGLFSALPIILPLLQSAELESLSSKTLFFIARLTPLDIGQYTVIAAGVVYACLGGLAILWRGLHFVTRGGRHMQLAVDAEKGNLTEK